MAVQPPAPKRISVRMVTQVPLEAQFVHHLAGIPARRRQAWLRAILHRGHGATHAPGTAAAPGGASERRTVRVSVYLDAQLPAERELLDAYDQQDPQRRNEWLRHRLLSGFVMETAPQSPASPHSVPPPPLAPQDAPAWIAPQLAPVPPVSPAPPGQQPTATVEEETDLRRQLRRLMGDLPQFGAPPPEQAQ